MHFKEVDDGTDLLPLRTAVNATAMPDFKPCGENHASALQTAK